MREAGKETERNAKKFVTMLTWFVPFVTAVIIAITEVLAQADLDMTAEKLFLNGKFVAAFSGGKIVQAYERGYDQPAVSRDVVKAALMRALEDEILDKMAAVVQTDTTGVETYIEDGSVKYRITLPADTFIDCGVESADRLVVYEAVAGQDMSQNTNPSVNLSVTLNVVLKKLDVVVSRDESGTPEFPGTNGDYVTIKLSSAVNVLVFCSKHDGEQSNWVTTGKTEQTASQPTEPESEAGSEDVTEISSEADNVVQTETPTERVTEFKRENMSMSAASPKTGQGAFVEW